MTPATQAKIEVVALCGVGTMGRILLRLLLQAGYTVYAYDPDASAQNYAEQAGARLSVSHGDAAAQAQAIILSLPTPALVRALVQGDSGIAARAPQGAYILDTSTVDPATSRAAAATAGEHGLHYLDAPLLGRPAHPEGWVSPVGGEREDFAAVAPLIESYASRAVHVGPLGAGNTLKLLNQTMFATLNCISAEVMAICEKTELTPQVLYDTIAGSGASTVSGLFKEVGRKICEADFTPQFTVNLLAKDARLAQHMAADYAAPSLLLANVTYMNALAIAQGYGQEDSSALFKAYRGMYQAPAPQSQEEG